MIVDLALAADGGTPVRSEPVPGWPHFDAGDVVAAGEVIASGRVNYWTGTHGRAFEEEFAAWSGCRYAVAVANGTVALELALRALGIGPGDEVIVPAATFIATAAAVASVGARPVVVDVCADRQSLTAETVRAALSPRTRAVVVVHLGGWPADVLPVVDLAREHGLRVVEDCAQAHGARAGGRPVGTFGDVAAWSFCQDKIMTTLGEGGAVTTDDPELFRRVWAGKDHGKDHTLAHTPDPPPGFRWLHAEFGTNARLTEMQAAVGRRQIERVGGWVARRRRHAQALRAALSDVAGLSLPAPDAGTEPSWYRVYAQVDTDRLRPGWDRTRIVQAVLAEGVPCSQGGCAEIYRERAFRRIWPPGRRLPVAAWLADRSLALLVHPTLSDADVADTAAAVAKVMAAAAH